MNKMNTSNSKLLLMILFLMSLCFSCEKKDGNESSVNGAADSTEISLNVSLSIFPTSRPNNIVYTITIINDSIVLKEFNRVHGYVEYKGKLTNKEYLEIKELTSALISAFSDEIFYRPGSGALGHNIFGCVLEIDNQVYFYDNLCALRGGISHASALSYIPEVKFLIEYITFLFDTRAISIVLPSGFIKPTPEEALRDSIHREEVGRIIRLNLTNHMQRRIEHKQ